ncbi:MAG: O-antigen ligase family protein [Paludibacter sp.]
MKQHFNTAINYFNLISLILLTATSVFHYDMQFLAFIFFFSSYTIELIVERKWERVKFDKKGWLYIILAVFFLLVFVYHPFENSNKYFDNLVSRRFALFGFAIVGFFGVNKKYKLSYFLNTFIISSVVAVFYLLFFRIGIVEFIINPLRNEVFAEARIEYVNTHMGFNIYLNIALVGIWYILTRSWRLLPLWKNLLYIGALSVIFGTLSISEGRSGFVTAIILMLSFIFYELWKRKRTMGIVIGFLVPFLFIGILSQHSRISEKIIKTEPRIFLWKAAISVIKEKPFFGYGISSGQEHYDVARAKYETLEYRKYARPMKILHTHNQLLQTTLEFGIFGLSILLFLLSFPIFIADKNRRFFAFLLIFTIVYQSMFDIIITGLGFASIFGILLLLILSIENNIVKGSQVKKIRK